MKADKETVQVDLGPSWYVDEQHLKVARGDRLEVTGSRMTRAGKSVLIAAQVKKGDQVLPLRDDRGIPRWSARGGR